MRTTWCGEDTEAQKFQDCVWFLLAFLGSVPTSVPGRDSGQIHVPNKGIHSAVNKIEIALALTKFTAYFTGPSQKKRNRENQATGISAVQFYSTLAFCFNL